MLRFVGSGFVKSLKVFQVVCRNWYWSFENAEKNFRKKEKQLARGRALSLQEKYELKRTKKISPKLNIAETVLSDLEEFQEKSEQVLVRRQH